MLPFALAPGLIGVGYERGDIDTFGTWLREADVSLIVDVRLTPISRRPGFSQRALAAALAEAGIAYEHAPELGNPKWNRPGFGGAPEELEVARANYREMLLAPRARERLAMIAEAASRQVVGLLCYEADERHCHRAVLLDALGPSGGPLPQDG